MTVPRLCQAYREGGTAMPYYNTGYSAIGAAPNGSERGRQPWRSWCKSPIWKSIRRHRLAEEPHCRQCALEGRTVVASHVDHIRPTSVSGRFSSNMTTLKAYAPITIVLINTPVRCGRSNLVCAGGNICRMPSAISSQAAWISGSEISPPLAARSCRGDRDRYFLLPTHEQNFKKSARAGTSHQG